MSNKITIFGMCVPCKVLVPVRHLTSTSFHGSVNKVKFLVVKYISQIL